MDNKTIFSRTSKGEEEAQSRTSLLPGELRRALSMVDGVATFGEISKRSAPSMRANLAEMFEEMEKNGFIQSKDPVGKTPKMAMPPKMAIPVKIAKPRKNPQQEEGNDGLDFMSGYSGATGEPDPEEEARLKAEAESRAKREIEEAKLKAKEEAEAIFRKAEQEAAKLKAEQEAQRRLEAAAREREAAEAARIKAEEEAKRAREELEAAKRKAEQEAQLRLEAAERERKEAEEKRLKAEREAAQMQIELEVAKRRAELEAQAQREAEAKAFARIQAEAEAKQREAAKKASEEARQREAARKASEAAAQSAQSQPVQEAKNDFAFDSFQLDGATPLPGSGKKAVPEQGGQTAQSGDSKKQDTFAFDSFNVDEPQPAAPSRNASPLQQKSKPAASDDAARVARQAEAERAERQRAADAKRIEREAQQREAQRIAAEQAAAEEAARARAAAEAELHRKEEEKAAARKQMQAAFTEQPFESPRPEKTVKPVVRVPRQKFAWGKLVGFFVKLGIVLLILLAAVLFVVPYVMPMRDYMPKVQQLLADRLHQPVHLGYLSGRILPMPRLDLGEIYIGDAKQFQAATAQINFNLVGIFSDDKPIDSVDFQEVRVRGIGLQNAVSWLQKLANDPRYPVSRMTIAQGTLDADAVQLTGVQGDLRFTPEGKFIEAKLNANSGAYALGIRADKINNFQTDLSIHDNALPLLPNWVFDSLEAKGELTANQFRISEFNAKISGATVEGHATLDWHSGWLAEGVLKAKAIDMQNFSKLLDGKADGSAHFRMSAVNLGGLTDSATLDGNFVSSDGTLGGSDIVETARKRSKENIPGGRNHYDKLSGEMSYADGTYHFKDVQIAGDVLDATATFDIAKQQLSGKVVARVSIHDNKSPPVTLKLDGDMNSPTLLYVP